MLKLIISFVVFVFSSVALNAETHQATGSKDEFDQAGKYVEKKNFLEAIKLFSKLAESGIPEAQYNLSLFYSNGLGSPKNFRLSLYWAWQAHLNDHENAMERVTSVFDLIDENLRNSVAGKVVEELLLIANAGDKVAPLKLGKTYLGLFVEAQNNPAYIWLSIAQAYGDENASSFLEQAAAQLTLEEILAQQDEAHTIFQNIPNSD